MVNITTVCYSMFDRQEQTFWRNKLPPSSGPNTFIILKMGAAISPETLAPICQTTEHCNPCEEICKFLSYNMSCKRVVPRAVLLT